jgi:hypothetical protein
VVWRVWEGSRNARATMRRSLGRAPDGRKRKFVESSANFDVSTKHIDIMAACNATNWTNNC